MTHSSLDNLISERSFSILSLCLFIVVYYSLIYFSIFPRASEWSRAFRFWVSSVPIVVLNAVISRSFCSMSVVLCLRSCLMSPLRSGLEPSVAAVELKLPRARATSNKAIATYEPYWRCSRSFVCSENFCSLLSASFFIDLCWRSFSSIF